MYNIETMASNRAPHSAYVAILCQSYDLNVRHASPMVASHLDDCRCDRKRKPSPLEMMYYYYELETGLSFTNADQILFGM